MPTRPFLYLLLTLYAGAVLGYAAQSLWRRPLLGRYSLALVTAGLLLHTGLLIQRWLTAGYLPVTNLFATLFFFSWTLALTFLYFELRYRLGAAGLFVMLLNLLLLGGALPRDQRIPPLVPSLDTPLFALHIIFSFAGYAMFAMAFALAVLYLLQTRMASPAIPATDLLRRLNEEAIFLGFGLFTLCMVAGGLWAYIAWGYWFSWNIKSLWSFLVWLFYAGMCHAKFVRRWQGGVYAWLSVAGFAVVLFTYLGIGLLLESNHPLE